MGLTTISSAGAATTPQADKSISLVHYNGTTNQNTIYYTVPVGRKFKGLVWVNDVSYKLGKLPGHTGSEQHTMPFASNTQLNYIPVETGPGDFVSGGNSYAYHSIAGVESDV